MERYERDFNSFLENFKRSVSKQGFKNSIQKDYILKILFFSKEHLSAEDIVHIAKKEYNIDMGIATVYRTVKFFESMSIIKSLDVGDGTKRFELDLDLHHDHMICTSCNKIFEFHDEEIEKRQLLVAKKNGFVLKDHIMTIYGLCEDCK